jgi:hypothetical protein
MSLSPAYDGRKKLKEFRHSRPIGPAGVLGQSWQSCAETGSRPVENRVDSCSCEGFEQKPTAPAQIAARMLHFFGETIRTTRRPRP